MRRVRVWSLYVPNGRAPATTSSFKLDWLTALLTVRPVVGPRPSRANRTGWRLECRTDRYRRLGHPRNSRADPRHRRGTRGIRRLRAGRVHRHGPIWIPQDLHVLGLPTVAVPRNQGIWIDFVLCSPALNDRVFDASIDKAARRGRRQRPRAGRARHALRRRSVREPQPPDSGNREVLDLAVKARPPGKSLRHVAPDTPGRCRHGQLAVADHGPPTAACAGGERRSGLYRRDGSIIGVLVSGTFTEVTVMPWSPPPRPGPRRRRRVPPCWRRTRCSAGPSGC